MTLSDYDWLDGSELRHDEVFESGWASLLGILLSEIDGVLSGTSTRLQLRQVKEKFGTLRFYHRLDSADPSTARKIREAVDRAASASSQTCFRCGQLAVMRNMTGWIVPLCDEHVATIAAERS